MTLGTFQKTSKKGTHSTKAIATRGSHDSALHMQCLNTDRYIHIILIQSL